MKLVITIVFFAIQTINNEIDCSTLPPEEIQKWAEHLDKLRENAYRKGKIKTDPVNLILRKLESNTEELDQDEYEKLINSAHRPFQDAAQITLKMKRGLTDEDINEVMKYRERNRMYGSRAAMWEAFEENKKKRFKKDVSDLRQRLKAKALKGKSQQGIEKPSTSHDTSSMEVGAQQPDEDIDQFMKRMGLEEEKKDERKSVESGKSKGKTKKKSKGGKSRT